MNDFTGESNLIVDGRVGRCSSPNSRLYPWRWGKSEFAGGGQLGWGQPGEGRAWKPEDSGCGLCLGWGLVCTDLGASLAEQMNWDHHHHPHWDELVLTASALSAAVVQGEKSVISSCWKSRIPVKSELFKAWFKIPLLQMCARYSNLEVVSDNLLYIILNSKRKREIKKTSWRIGFFKNWVTYCETLIPTHVLYIVFNHNAVKWPLVVSSSYCVVSKRGLDREEFLRLLWCYSARNMLLPVEKKNPQT